MKKSVILFIGLAVFILFGLANVTYAPLARLTSPQSMVCPSPPAEYLMRSSCPFSSAVIDGECRVVCPVRSGSDYHASCQRDTDCNCSTTAVGGSTECRCAGQKCVVVVNKGDVKNWP